MHHRFCLGLALAMTTAACTDDNFRDSPSLDMLVPEHLVLAKFVSVSGNDKQQLTCSLRITHVYKGSKRLKDKTFSVKGNRYEGGLGIVIFNGIPKEGELSVWAVNVKCSEVSTLTPATQKIGFAVLPVRSGDKNARFTETQAWAHAVETVHRASEDQQSELLKCYARSSISEISGWAIQVLGHNRSLASTDYFKNLLDDKLPVSGEVALDAVLMDRLEVGWMTSDDRKELLLGWARRDLDDRMLGQVLSHLAASMGQQQLSMDILLQVIRKALENDTLSDGSKRMFIFLVGKLPVELRSGPRVLDFLLSLLDKSSPQHIQLSAAYAMRNFVPLDRESSTKIRKVMDDLTDKEVNAILQEALEKNMNDPARAE